MENSTTFILGQYKEVALLAVIVVISLVFYKDMTINWLKNEISLLMLGSEKINRKNLELKGEQLMEMVVATTLKILIPRLPFWIQPFISEEYIRNIAQLLHDKAKDYIDDGKLNNSIESSK